MKKDFFDDYLDDDFDEEEDEELDEKKPPKPFTKGFLTALAVCMIAIGAAVWTTVSSVSSYLNPTVTIRESSDTDAEFIPSASSETDARVNATVSASKPQSGTDADKPVVFNCEPLKNKKVIEPYSEEPVYNATLGDYRAHTGIDYEAEVDDKVRAMGQGVVKDVYSDDLLGNVVVIEHSRDVDSYYCGLAKTALVQPGEVVNAGDFVGTVYAIPGEAAEEAHVHVAVKEKGQWVDPRKFMKQSREE